MNERRDMFQILAEATTQPALPQALRLSGVALVAIFVVMGLFAVLITFLGRLFPDEPAE
jgi:predicted DNA repair protein MutK